MTERIDAKEFFAITFIYIVANDLIRGIFAIELKHNVWIPVFLGIIGSLLIFSAYLIIYKNQNYPNFTEMIEHLMGKFLSKIFFIIYAVYFMLIAFLNSYVYFELVNGYLLDQSPNFIIVLACLYVSFYSARHGIEVLGRVLLSFFFGLIFFYITSISLLLILNQFKFDNFLPILEDGIIPIIKPAFQMSYSIPFGESFVLLILFQYVKNKKKKTKTPLLGILMSGLALLSLTILNIGLLGSEVMSSELSPSVGLSHLINFGNIIQRYDIIVIGLLAIYAFGKATLLIYVAKSLINATFPRKNEKIPRKRDAIVLGIVCLIIALVTIFTNVNYLKFILFRVEYIVPYVNLTFELIIPFILIILSFIRKPKEQLSNFSI